MFLALELVLVFPVKGEKIKESNSPFFMLLTVQYHFTDKKLVVQPFAMLCICILPLSNFDGLDI